MQHVSFKVISVKDDKHAKRLEKEYEELSRNKAIKKFLQVSEALQFWERKNAPVNECQKPQLSFEDTIINQRIEATRFLLIQKGAEYVRNNDRCHNFRRAAEIERTTMPRALHGMLQKHIVSYMDMLDDIDKGKLPADDLISEKLGDIIVYFHLQEAVIRKHKQETLNKQNYPTTNG